MSETTIIMPVEHRRALPAPTAEVTSIFQVLERAARDPNVDVDKMERLMAMAERAHDRSARVAYNAALAEMQPKLPVVNERGRIEVPAKDGKTGHSTPFAKWEDINDAIRPMLAEYGFALSFRVGMAQDGKIEVTGVLSHREGHSEQTMITLMHDSSGSKNAVQAVGSSTSYGKRYTAMALLNITTRGEDDDARLAGMGATLTPEQITTIQELIESVGADKPRFLKFMAAENIASILAKDFDRAVNMLNAKARR